ncbi:MAG: DUF1622 domain-containing protein [Nitrososphaeraceae archaeon]
MEVEIQTLTEIIERFLDPYLSILILIIDIFAGVVIGISAILAFISYLKIIRKRTHEQINQQESIRLRLARGMLFALDFEIGADILKTVLVPSPTDLAILSVVVAIRIILSWSLSKEIERHGIKKED